MMRMVTLLVAALMTLSLSGRRVTDARWTPMRVSADGIPRVPDDAAARDRLLDRWNATRRCAGLAAGPPA